MNSKTIVIDGKPVVFKADGAFPIRYTAAFGRDFFADLSKFDDAGDDYSKFDSLAMYQLAYTAAKTADSTLPPFTDWFAAFDSFPIFTVFMDLIPMIWQTVSPEKKYSAVAETAEER